MVVSQVNEDPLERLWAQIAEARRAEQEPEASISGEVGVGADPLERLLGLMAGDVEGPSEQARAAPGAPGCGGPGSQVSVSVSAGGASRPSSSQAFRGEAGMETGSEAWVGRAVLDLLAEQPLAGPARAELARALAGALSRPSVSAEELRRMLAIVLSGLGPNL